MNTRMVASIMLLIVVTFVVFHEAKAESPADTAKASLENYFRAWHEPDTEKRTELLNTAWAKNGTYTDPSAHVDGRDALVAHIGRFLSNPQLKGFAIARTSEIDLHHQTFRFEWEMKDSSGNVIAGGMDYGEFNENGVITKIVGFFGPFSALK